MKSSKARAAGLVQALLEGHQKPISELSENEKLHLQAFQQNFLSLLSHELNTPLLTIINQLYLLSQGIPSKEAVQTAQTQAMVLKNHLAGLMELGSLCSGARTSPPFREIRLLPWLENQLQLLKDSRTGVHLKPSNVSAKTTFLGNPDSLSKAIQRLLTSLNPTHYGLSGPIATPYPVCFENHETPIGSYWSFVCRWPDAPELIKSFDEKWSEAVAAREGRMDLGILAFSETYTAEKNFLTRTRSGLQIDLLLALTTLVEHGFGFEKQWTKQGSTYILELRLVYHPLSGLEKVEKILSSKGPSLLENNNAFGLICLPLEEVQTSSEVSLKLSERLFRSQDQLFEVPEKRQILILIEDILEKDFQTAWDRISNGITQDLSKKAKLLHFPTLGWDPLLSYRKTFENP